MEIVFLKVWIGSKNYCISEEEKKFGLGWPELFVLAISVKTG